MNPSLSAAAANGTIKGFNALSNGNGEGKAAPIMLAKVNALAGQPRHARGSSAPELGFNQLSSSSSSSSCNDNNNNNNQEKEHRIPLAGPHSTPSPYFGGTLLMIGGVEQNAPPVPYYKTRSPLRTRTANVAGGAGGGGERERERERGGGGGGGGERTKPPDENLNEPLENTRNDSTSENQTWKPYTRR